jgi:hypothetical protein
MVLSMADQRASQTSSGWVCVVFVTMTRMMAKVMMTTPRPTTEPMAIFSARERLTTQSSFQGRAITAGLSQGRNEIIGKGAVLLRQGYFR